jgi:glycosyltransferase involved in cell wall biosynthesis
MIVPQANVKGGIAAVVSGYYGSRLEKDFDVTYVESYRDGSKWQKFTKAIRAYREFRRVLGTKRPDIVHVHSSFGPSFYRKLPIIAMSHRAGIPVVNHVHGSALEEFYLNAPGWKQQLVRKVYGWCDRVIVLSEDWKEKLSAIIPKERIRVVPNYAAMHPEVLTEDMMRQRFAAHQVLFLGVITEGKGLYEMPEVIRRVLTRVPDARFVICGVGDDGYLAAHLSEEEYRHVTLPGWVRGEEKEANLRGSTVFWLPSHMEAMPMSALDAMGYGLPVVATNAGGIPNVVQDGMNGILTNVRDTEAMAAALVHFLTNEAAFRAAGEQSLRIVQEKFSLDAHIAGIEQVYGEVLGS